MSCSPSLSWLSWDDSKDLEWSCLHWDQFVFPLLHLLLKGLDIGWAVHRLRLQDVVVQHHLDAQAAVYCLMSTDGCPTWMSSTPLRIDTPDSLYGSHANLTCAVLLLILIKEDNEKQAQNPGGGISHWKKCCSSFLTYRLLSFFLTRNKIFLSFHSFFLWGKNFSRKRHL